ncbi:thioredoxin domain-containing protein 5-like [Anneissia japonica]|uniref:thioredoxin domain-containing protein 5-like n=1 Tax=Anneissia japonica TaxID=1529436 RepID=UPI0014256A7F|nr:thioredoxin domain-containing protein 5-like [Anneissia japonica]
MVEVRSRSRLFLVSFGLNLACLISADHGSADSIYDTEKFSKEVPLKPHFIMFFAPWCGHCKRLSPTWDELAEKYNEDENSKVSIAKVDCTVETQLCAENGVKGVSYTHLDVQVNILTDENFVDGVSKGLTFVKFYAPWCGHCKRLAPTWETLATEVVEQKDVSIAKVDCTVHKSTCQKYEVRGYPTLLLFKNGKNVEKYGKSRELDSLLTFVNEKVAQVKDEL